jgi:hypothetical protein
MFMNKIGNLKNKGDLIDVQNNMLTLIEKGFKVNNRSDKN